MFPPRLRRGTRHPGAPLSPCFAAEEHPRGYPDVASGGYSYPAFQLGALRGGAVSSESDIRVPEAKRGRVPL